jgi:hypothetical protein
MPVRLLHLHLTPDHWLPKVLAKAAAVWAEDSCCGAVDRVAEAYSSCVGSSFLGRLVGDGVLGLTRAPRAYCTMEILVVIIGIFGLSRLVEMQFACCCKLGCASCTTMMVYNLWCILPVQRRYVIEQATYAGTCAYQLCDWVLSGQHNITA